MAAPKFNQFWKLRSKHGRDKIFETPEIMLEAAYEYFKWCVDNPLFEDHIEKLKKNGIGEAIEHVPLAKMRAFTLNGLCVFLGVNSVYFNQFEENLKTDENEIDKDFSKVITHIRDIIYEQKFTGAAAGLLNANIIARDLGLKDRSDITTKDKELPSAENFFLTSDDFTEED